MAPNRRPLPHENVVSAGVVGVAAPKVAGASVRGKVMEEKMAKAIMDALAEGVSINSPEIKARIMAARGG
jgi:hypothetical protein